MCPDVIAYDFSVFVHHDLMNGAIAEVAYIQIAILVENNSIQPVLYVFILRDNSRNQVLVRFRIRYLYIFIVLVETIHAAYQ